MPSVICGFVVSRCYSRGRAVSVIVESEEDIEFGMNKKEMCCTENGLVGHTATQVTTSTRQRQEDDSVHGTYIIEEN